MKFACPYCHLEYNTTHDFSDSKITCASCRRLFLPGTPAPVQTPSDTVILQLEIHRSTAPAKDGSTIAFVSIQLE